MSHWPTGNQTFAFPATAIPAMDLQQQACGIAPQPGLPGRAWPWTAPPNAADFHRGVASNTLSHWPAQAPPAFPSIPSATLLQAAEPAGDVRETFAVSNRHPAPWPPSFAGTQTPPATQEHQLDSVAGVQNPPRITLVPVDASSLPFLPPQCNSSPATTATSIARGSVATGLSSRRPSSVFGVAPPNPQSLASHLSSTRGSFIGEPDAAVATSCHQDEQERATLTRRERRERKLRSYKSKPCRHFHREGGCRNGEACPFIHDASDLLAPAHREHNNGVRVEQKTSSTSSSSQTSTPSVVAESQNDARNTSPSPLAPLGI